jgi:hypothetical protein
MSRSIRYCPNCETECFDDVPCSKCGYVAPVETFEKKSIPDNRDNWRKSYQKTFVNPELNNI